MTSTTPMKKMQGPQKVVGVSWSHCRGEWMHANWFQINDVPMSPSCSPLAKRVLICFILHWKSCSPGTLWKLWIRFHAVSFDTTKPSQVTLFILLPLSMIDGCGPTFRPETLAEMAKSQEMVNCTSEEQLHFKRFILSFQQEVWVRLLFYGDMSNLLRFCCVKTWQILSEKFIRMMLPKKGARKQRGKGQRQLNNESKKHSYGNASILHVGCLEFTWKL